jgi:hypothetical protein
MWEYAVCLAWGFVVGESEHRSSVAVYRSAFANVLLFDSARLCEEASRVRYLGWLVVSRGFWCRSLQLLLEAFSGGAFVRMVRNMCSNFEGWVFSNSSRVGA